MHSISCRHTNMDDGSKKSEFRRNALVGLILAVTFGLGWIFGLLGTTDLPNAVRLPSVYLFTILVGTQGLLIFVLRVLRSNDVRSEWKKWFYILTCRIDSYSKSSHLKAKHSGLQGSSGATLQGEQHHISSKSTTLTSDSSGTLHSHGYSSDTLRRAVQHQLDSVTEEVDATIEESPATFPQVRKLTVIENRQIADSLDLHESGVPALVTSELLEPSIPLSPLTALSGQQLQSIRQRAVVFGNIQVDCEEDRPDNADSWSEWIEGDVEATETVFYNFGTETMY